MRKVDHESRREEIAEVAAQLIAENGLNALTTRALAKRMGCSIGVLSHYFGGKDDIVLAAFNWADARIDARVSEAVAREGAKLDSFIPLILAALPLDGASDLEWKVRFNLFTCSFSEPHLLTVQREKIQGMEQLLTGVIRDMQADNQIRRDFKAEYMTFMAFDIVMGLAQNLLMLPLEERENRAHYMMSLFEPLQAGGRLRVVETTTLSKQA
jgi:AcrR family transcriptional regulator